MESVILIRNILYQIRYDVEDPQLGADSGKRNSLYPSVAHRCKYLLNVTQMFLQRKIGQDLWIFSDI